MLSKINIKDFCLYEDVQLDLGKLGMVWVVGENKDTLSATSNGSGKTTLTKAITWCLYGKVIDPKARNDEIGDDVIRIGAKEAVVKIWLVDFWSIERARTKGKPRVVLYDPEGNPWRGTDTQEQIEYLIGLDFHGFKNTSLFGQNDTARFASPMISDQRRKDMLHKLLRTEALSGCCESAKRHAGALRILVSNLETDIKVLETRIEDYEKVDEERQENAELWEDNRTNRMNRIKSEIEDLKEKAKEASRGSSALPTLRAKHIAAQIAVENAKIKLVDIDALLDKKGVLREEDSALQRALDKVLEKIRVVQGSLRSLEGDECEVCSSPLDVGAPKAKIDSLKIEESKLIAQRKELKSSISAKLDQIESVSEAIKEARKDREKHSELEMELDEATERVKQAESGAKEAKAFIDSAKRELVTLKEIKAEENPWKIPLEKSAEIDLHRKYLKVKKTELENAKFHWTAYKFWAEGFGPKGLQSFVLDEPMPYLTERANNYLETLSDGDITVEFKTQRELKTAGALKDEISINWTIEGVPNKTPSGGQQRKIEIATDFAFMDLAETREGANLDIFIADEILDGLDSEGQERALELLVQLRKKRGTIIVISHSNMMSELFEKTLTITKRGGVSTVSEAE